ncbi:Armadillo repeat-containing protein 3 [Amphibalanus amphitrite]|uniref:Armadillo repeat-containing protein 3 n=1 Tax=Amphibalanus amphitrite TaxID=1232801 RepID=A0A6A4WVX8_AMPAM|nr:Armadillo repeat-containing protein 3 [Amphibalanus amphitrite]
MLNATEEDLVLKSCQSLYKFAHEAEVNQQLLLQYDILRLLLDHLGHSNPQRAAPLLVAVCEALGVISMSLRARHALVEHHSVNLILNLLKSDYPAVRSAAVEALQMQSADPAAAGAALLPTRTRFAALRRLRCHLSSEGHPADRGARGTSPVSERPPARPVPPEDPRLAAYVSYVRQTVAPQDCASSSRRPSWHSLWRTVMGGTVSRDQLPTWSAERQLSELRRQRASNVLPVGEVSRGGLRCRALLFKFLADQINVPCTLTRGSFGKYWNSVFVTDRSRGAPAGAYAEKVVDLIHQPGTLMTVGTGDAVSYTTGF